MSSDASESSSRDRHFAIDQICDEFELGWQQHKDPSLAEYLRRFDEKSRANGFCELLRVELEIRCQRRESPSIAEYQRRFPGFAPQVVKVFRESTASGRQPDLQGVTQQLATSPPTDCAVVADGIVNPSDVQPTIDHTPSRKESRGLRIRCPHCSNAVELLADTAYADISCNSCGSSFSLVDRDESTRMAPTLQTVDRFELIGRLGVGGFGTVWKARDKELQRTVAIKIPRRGQLSPQEIEQFYREARSAAQLRHKNIVPVHEVGRDGETLFIVSDFIRGVSLHDWLSGKRPTPRDVAELLIPVMEALQHAHKQGVIHRDLKPSNIMIDEEGQPHLMDFGLAKRETGEITMTVDGQILGTPRYMSPEQAAGEGHWTDRRTDIYSSGVMLFEMLTGEAPFRGNAQMQIHQRLTEDPPDPRKLNRHIPRDLATICLKCLEREPGRRFDTAAELCDELRRFVRGEPTKSRPISHVARLMRYAKRKPWVSATVALIGLLAVAGPIAAVSIESQRRQLAIRYQERDQLIQTNKLDIDRLQDTKKQLESELAVWNGKVSPTEFWPPKREKPPRLALLSDLFDRSKVALGPGLRSDKFTLEQKAQGYMALASMADALQDIPHAREYYQAACDVLKTLTKQNPENAQFARALARCELGVANVTSDNSEKVAKAAERARSIYQRLASGSTTDVVPQVEWLESELNSALTAGYENGYQHLIKTARIKDTLTGHWPNDPNGIYQVTCFLNHEEPLLLHSNNRDAASSSAPAANPTSR